MMRLLLGAAIGYVLGARAGRSRYEQLMRNYRKLADHPAVQSAAGVARAKVTEKMPFGGNSAKSKPASAATAAPAEKRPSGAQG